MRMDTSHHALDMNCAGIASNVTLDEPESATCSSINPAPFKLRERSRRDRVPFPQSDSGVAIHFDIGTNDGSRPKLAVRDFLSHWPLYFVSRRSLNSSRRTEFGASGRYRISTSDVSKIAAGRLLSKIRQCANDPEQSAHLPESRR